jgi:TonB-dependent starch-binding outer membrane protein SusC
MNQSPAQGFTLASAVNTDLVWESTEKKNIGLDITMLNNKLYVITDVFMEDTYDLLFTQPIPLSTGLAGSPYINAGQVRNTGIEMELGYRESRGDWHYSGSVNWTNAKNEVIDLEGRDLRTSGIVEGYPLRSFFGYKTNGLDKDTG